MAVAILNFGTRPTVLSLVVSSLFTLLGILAVVHSFFTYLYRSKLIRERRIGRYHDAYGPTVLMLVLLTSIVLNWVTGATELKVKGS